MTVLRQVRTPETAAPRWLPVIRLVFTATVCFGIWQYAGVAVAAGVRDCIAFEESEAEDAITYRNDCNRSILFYYCVIDPQRSEVAPCRRVITGTRKVVVQVPRVTRSSSRKWIRVPPMTSSCGAAPGSN